MEVESKLKIKLELTRREGLCRLRRDENLLENWEQVWNKLSDYEQKAIALAYSNEKITASMLSEHIDRSIVSARRVLQGLKEKGVFAWYGTSTNDSKQYYKLKNK